MQAVTRPPSEPGAARFTREEYHRMADVGLFDGRRVQLLDGVIVEMPRMNNPHVIGLRLMREALLARLPAGAVLDQQVPITRGLAGAWIGSESEPEPDAAVYAGDSDAAPLLVVEISDTTQEIDQHQKPALYARAGAPVYWALDLKRRELHIFTEPDGERYRAHRLYWRDEPIPLPWPAEPIRVADLLPAGGDQAR
jgi:Uma2 family endonuclease